MDAITALVAKTGSVMVVHQTYEQWGYTAYTYVLDIPMWVGPLPDYATALDAATEHIRVIDRLFDVEFPNGLPNG